MLRSLVPLGCGYNTVPQTILSEVESILDSVFSDNTAFFTNSVSSYPKSNLIELEDKYVIEMAVAGLSKSDLSIKLDDDNKLTIEGEKKPKYDNAKYHIKELSSRSFKKVITLPSTVDNKKISSKFSDGILEIIIPKKTEKQLKNSITNIVID